jgi:hypothetical protein
VVTDVSEELIASIFRIGVSQVGDVGGLSGQKAANDGDMFL